MDKERRMIVDELASAEARSWMKESFKTHWKNSEEAWELRIKGNNLFAEMSKDDLQMEEIYKLYSQSIAFAERGSEELAFGYGNRSAILFRMKKYKECISDIDSALKINNYKKFNIKLLCRKVECMKKLIGLNTESEKLFSELESLVSAMKDEDTNKKTLKESMKRVKNMRVPCIESDRAKNQEIPKHVKLLNDKENENPFDSVSIKSDKKYGRYLVANRDFMPGEIVFVEKPYVKVVNIKNSYNFCGHCLAVSWATIPCNYCSWCMFCSEDCKRTSWESYHNFECTAISQIIYRNDVSRIVHKKCGGNTAYEQLAIRALILGTREAGSIANLKDEIENINLCAGNHTQGFEKNGTFKSLGLKSMYTLSDDVPTTRLSLYTKICVFLLIFLIKHTSIFDKNKNCNPENILVNDDILFIGSLLLKLCKISDINSYQLPGKNLDHCKYCMNSVTCKATACCERGFGILIINSLINNDCHPHVANIFCKKSNKFTVCSLRPIKKDSQICVSYLETYFDLSSDKRQAILKHGFNFTCTCIACEENWPTIDEQLSLFQNDPAAYFSSCQPKERYHSTIQQFDVDNSTLNTIQIISKATCEAHKDLKHPSITLWRLESGLELALQSLYENC